jgi:hypothetical protein
MSTAPSKVVPGTLWLDSRPLHGRGQGGSGERLPPREVEVHARWKPEREAKDKIR